MSCIKTFFSDEEVDIPLDAAIYSAISGKIYGVRGQFIHMYNATSGARESTFRFVDCILNGWSSIVECGGFLYVGTWNGPIVRLNDFYDPFRDIWKIDYNLLTSTAMMVNDACNGITAFCLDPTSSNQWQAGFSSMVTNGVIIRGSLYPSGQRYFGFDPADVPGTTFMVNIGNRGSVTDFDYDSDWNVIYITEASVSEVNIRDFTTLAGGLADAQATPTPTQEIFGICHVPNGGGAGVPKAYGVTGGQDIFKFNVNESLPLGGAIPFTWSILAGILPSGARPFKIKYNPHDGKIYVPNWSADSVTIIDPQFDIAVNTIGGFDSPIDIIFTPTKVFAVQNSSRGLKEV